MEADALGKAALGARFAENLFEARRSANLSQEQLADRVGLHRTEISKLELTEREPRLGTIVKLAAGLEVSIEDLTRGLSWQPHQPGSGQARGRFIVE